MKLRTTKLTAIAPAMLALAVAMSPAHAQDDTTTRTRDDATIRTEGDAAIRPEEDTTRVRAQENVARSDTRVSTDAARGSLIDGQILQIVRTLNDAEIKQADEALGESESEPVKQVAEMIKADHEAANEQMDELLEGPMNLEDSDTNESVADQAEATHEMLQDLSGAEYDCAYLQQQVAQHETAIQMATNDLAPNAKDAGVKAFLTAMTPKLEGHMQMAKDAMGQVSGCSTTN